MKTASLILLIFLLTINIYSQEGSPEPVTAGKHFLVHSAGLPEEFLLFSPDTASQILFNPARANDFSKNFIFVNYLSDYSTAYTYPIYFLEGYPVVLEGTGKLQKANAFNFPELYQDSYTNSDNPTFSAAALINTGSQKWLFELTNGINSYNSAQVYHFGTYFETVPIFRYTQESNETSQENRFRSTTTSIKISRVFKAGELNLSTGIYGIVRTNNSEADLLFSSGHYTFKDISYQDSLRFRAYSNSEGKTNSYLKNTRYVLGLQFTAGSEIFDYVGSIDYEFGDNAYESLNNSNDYSYDSSQYNPTLEWEVHRMEGFSNSRQFSSYKPMMINISNYFRHELGLLSSGENIFISAGAFYSPGNISYQDTSRKITRGYYGNETYGDTVTTRNINKYDITDWGVTVSTGYILDKDMDDISILTGLRILGSIEHLNSVDRTSLGTSQPGFTEYVLKPSIFAVTLPLYINYSLAQWISVYGGMNYSYAYSYNKSEQTLNAILNQISRSTMTTHNYYNRLNQGWHSFKSIYFGCELRHPSGLRAQFLFDGDIANVADWNVSLGWVF